jgi:hypothetical protein
MAEGKRLGVKATPTFFLVTFGQDGDIALQRRIEGALPYEAFKTLISELLSNTTSRLQRPMCRKCLTDFRLSGGPQSGAGPWCCALLAGRPEL